MQTISEQADVLHANLTQLVASTHRLEENYRSKIEKMFQKMSEFVEQYAIHSRMSIAEYASYLNHDALSPLTIVLGYAELFRSVHAHILTMDELSQANVICEQIRTLTECLRTERDDMIALRDQYTTTGT